MDTDCNLAAVATVIAKAMKIIFLLGSMYADRIRIGNIGYFRELNRRGKTTFLLADTIRTSGNPLE
jgi:hypothetical protein